MGVIEEGAVALDTGLLLLAENGYKVVHYKGKRYSIEEILGELSSDLLTEPVRMVPVSSRTVCVTFVNRRHPLIREHPVLVVDLD